MGVRVTIAAEAADAYFRVRGAQTRMTLAEAELKADSDLLELVLLRLKEGMATEREQAQAEARLAQVRATLPPLRAEREVQLNRLDLLMGVPPGSYAAELVTPQTEASISVIYACYSHLSAALTVWSARLTGIPSPSRCLKATPVIPKPWLCRSRSSSSASTSIMSRWSAIAA